MKTKPADRGVCVESSWQQEIMGHQRHKEHYTVPGQRKQKLWPELKGRKSGRQVNVFTYNL